MGNADLSYDFLAVPKFVALVRRWSGAPVNDVYCGLRGFTREFYDRLDQRCIGAKFATEMVIRAGIHLARVGR